MKKFIVALIITVLVGAGCAPKVAPEPGRGADVIPELRITVTTRMANDAPVGQDVRYSGILNQSAYYSGNEPENVQGKIDGVEIGRRGYYWAGIKDDVVFVQSGDTLQVLQEVSDENGNTTPRTVLTTIELPPNTRVIVGE